MTTKITKPTARPFSIRLTVEERALLVHKAKGAPLGSYIRATLFPEHVPTVPPARQRIASGHKELARLLAAFGSSRLAANFNQIAKAAHQGSLPVTKELEDELWAACAQIRDMREQLLRALGVKSKQSALSKVFNRSASAGGVR